MIIYITSSVGCDSIMLLLVGMMTEFLTGLIALGEEQYLAPLQKTIRLYTIGINQENWVTSGGVHGCTSV